MSSTVGNLIISPVKGDSTLQEELADAESEWLLEVICFLDPADGSRYGATCKHARHLIRSNYLWNFYGTKFIACIQSPLKMHHYVEEATHVLKFPDPKSLYLCLHKAKRSLIGWYRIVPEAEYNLQSDQLPFTRGGLVCIRMDKTAENPIETVVLEIIEPSGKRICKMTVTYVQCQRKLVCKLHNKGIFRLEFCESGIKLIAVSRDMNYLIQPLPRNFQDSKTTVSNIIRSTVQGSVGRITGLFAARYGSHGQELLHVSLVENDERILEGVDAQSTELKGPFYVINGLKVTGDPNVPAAQLSFTVDVTHLKNCYSWVLSDPRPIVLFNENGIVDATMMTDRQNNIFAAYRGKGQINREPETWDPEWVDLTLIIYTDSSGSRGASFSIVWDDVGETYRHLMDFFPFKGENYPPIDPPMTWSTTDFEYSAAIGS